MKEASNIETLVVIMPMLHGKTTLARAYPSVAVDADAVFGAQPASWHDRHRAAMMRRDWEAVNIAEAGLLDTTMAPFQSGRLLLVHNDGLLRHARTTWLREVRRWRAVAPLRLGDVLHRARARVGGIRSSQEAAAMRGAMELAISNWRHHVDSTARWTAMGIPTIELPAVIRLAADRSGAAGRTL